MLILAALKFFQCSTTTFSQILKRSEVPTSRQDPLLRMPARCEPIFRHTGHDWLGDLRDAAPHPGGITSPICPEICCSGFCQCGTGYIFLWEKGKSGLLHFHLALLPAATKPPPPPFYCLLFAVHTNLSPLINTVHYPDFFFIAFPNKLTFCYIRGYYWSRRGKPDVFVWLFFFRLLCVPARLVCLCLFQGNFMNCEDTDKCVSLPLLSLISTAAWASSSREISSLLPLRAAWCSGDNLHTDTDYV